MGARLAVELAVFLALTAAPFGARAGQEAAPEQDPAALRLPQPATADQPPPAVPRPPAPPATEPAKNALYFELVGTCIVYRFNYERRLARAWPLRVGTGLLPPVWPTDPFVLTPAATLGRLLGGGNHQLELAAGAVAWARVRRHDSAGIFATAVIGYRYQPP